MTNTRTQDHPPASPCGHDYCDGADECLNPADYRTRLAALGVTADLDLPCCEFHAEVLHDCCRYCGAVRPDEPHRAECPSQEGRLG